MSPVVENKRVVLTQWVNGKFCVSMQHKKKKNWCKRSFKSDLSYLGYSYEKAAEIFEKLSGYKTSVGELIAKKVS
jgi:hypothetical protein